MRPGGQPLLIYDGGCGFCNRAVRTAARLDGSGRVRFAAFQECADAELAALGLSRADCERRLRFAIPGGRVWGGALAVNRFLLAARPGGVGGWLLRAGAILAFAVPPLLALEALAYEVVARNRSRECAPGG